MDVAKLSIKLLERGIVLNSAFIELLLHTSLANRLVGDIIQLGNEQVIDALLSILAHDAVDLGCLLLELQEAFHEGRTNIFILHRADHALILLAIIINLLYLLINGKALFTALLLQFLDEVEHSLLIELELCAEKELRLWVLHRLKLKVNVVFHAIRHQLENELLSQQVFINDRLIGEADIEDSLFLCSVTILLLLLFDRGLLLWLNCLLLALANVVADFSLYCLFVTEGRILDRKLDLGGRLERDFERVEHGLV